MGTLLVGTPNAGRRQAYYYDYYSSEGLDGPGIPASALLDEDEAADEAASMHLDDQSEDSDAHTDEVGTSR